MQVQVSSDHYDILSDGVVFLFGQDKDLTIHVKADNFNFSVSLYFLKDETRKQNINTESTEDQIVLKCFNFDDDGTGLMNPVEIAQVEGKKLYLMFWSYLQGSKEPKARSVQYTVFIEK